MRANRVLVTRAELPAVAFVPPPSPQRPYRPYTQEEIDYTNHAAFVGSGGWPLVGFYVYLLVVIALLAITAVFR
jgi:hypothetical protein